VTSALSTTRSPILIGSRKVIESIATVTTLLLGVAHTGERAGFIYQFHDPAAVDVAQQVGVFWVHELG
jgi:hypothetical protein